MSLSGTGNFCQPTACAHRHPWSAPEIDASSPIASGQLLMLNSLTGRKEPFVPMNARHVLWYTCGPTVYDSSHVGHARTYLSLDIMRRVMSDYFRYNVLYQINTTDIDDKIILRARQNELLHRLEGDASVDFAALSALAREALGEAKARSDEKGAAIEAALEGATAGGGSRARTEQEGLLEQHAFKRRNLDLDEANILRACGDASAATADAPPGGDDARADLFRAARSVLAEKLDRERGHLVTDHSVFNAHSRKYEKEFMDDMRALGIREPDVLTRVTEYVPKIVAFVEKIVAKGMAYASNGSVYLSLDALQAAGHNYRKLKPAGPGGGATAGTLRPPRWRRSLPPGAAAASSERRGGPRIARGGRIPPPRDVAWDDPPSWMLVVG